MIISKNGDLFIVKVYREYVNNFDIYDMDSILELFKGVLGKLKDKYKISGLCIIDVYVSEIFGMIIEVNNVYKYQNEIDVKITFHIDSIFMMEIDIDDLNNYDEIYYYKEKYFTNYNKDIDSNIIYKDSLDIVNKGIRLK